MYKLPPSRSFVSPLSSDGTALSIRFEVSNIYNCTITCVILFKRTLGVCCFKINAFKAISMSIKKNKAYFGVCTKGFEIRVG